jgi:hypothetical protein
LHEARKRLRKEITRMESPQKVEKPESRPGTWIAYSGPDDVEVLFWSRSKGNFIPALYSAIYPECSLTDEGVWERWDDPECVDQLRRLWSNAGVIRVEGDRVVGLVPIYTASDHERFAAWHVRTSRAIVDRFKEEEDTVNDLMHDFRGDCADKDNLRRITLLGRILARGVERVLHGGLFESAHDWGGLGRAFIWGQHQGLGPTGGYSIHTNGAAGLSLASFQQGRRFPGLEAIGRYGPETVFGMLGRLCTAPQSREALLAEAGDEEHAARRAAMLHELADVQWIGEESGLLSTILPHLPWSSSRDEHRVKALSERLTEPVVDAADELKALAAQSSFAHCRFADVAYMITAKMRWYVVRDLTREGIIVPQPDPIPPGWGAWICLSEGG